MSKYLGSFRLQSWVSDIVAKFYRPAELQFYTSLASIVVQIPATFLLVNIREFLTTTSYESYLAFILNGVFFHFQSITAYVLMDYISPVTHRWEHGFHSQRCRIFTLRKFYCSVTNTVKRAFLIWLSIIMFGNPVTLLSGLGTVIVIVGVTMYNKAQEYDNRHRFAKVRMRRSFLLPFFVF